MLSVQTEIPQPFVCLLEVNFGVLWGIIGAKNYDSIFYINSFLFVETDERKKNKFIFVTLCDMCNYFYAIDIFPRCWRSFSGVVSKSQECQAVIDKIFKSGICFLKVCLIMLAQRFVNSQNTAISLKLIHFLVVQPPLSPCRLASDLPYFRE